MTHRPDPQQLLAILDDLSRDLAALSFSDPVAHVYDPLQYAREPVRLYVERYAPLAADTLLIGMNPGPWGMAQTGIPFGAISPTRDWLDVAATVEKPAAEHPKRPIEGFDTAKDEVSGMRLWGWAESRFGTPERFFERLFIHNYCPLCFLGDTGRNLTPDKLRVAERRPLLEVCDRGLRRFVEAWGAHRVIGVGAWAETRAKAALDGLDVTIGKILHPSPASPAANRGWAAQAEPQLVALGVELP
ncbi:MAG: single-stranded DNA-binding protein [Acidobacteriota bacterium]